MYTPAGKATHTSGLYSSEDLEIGGVRDTTCLHKAKDITPSIAWRRQAWEQEALDKFIFLERTREGHRQSDDHWNYIKGLKVSETVNYDYGMHGDWYGCGE